MACRAAEPSTALLGRVKVLVSSKEFAAPGVELWHQKWFITSSFMAMRKMDQHTSSGRFFFGIAKETPSCKLGVKFVTVTVVIFPHEPWSVKFASTRLSLISYISM